MAIGDFVQGGILFYSGTTVLIASTQDIIIPLYWGCYKVGISGTTTSIGSGSNNTTLIFNSCTGNTMIAADVCYNLSLSGYTDWFLPSKDELNEMYLKKTIIGGFDVNTNYWSSSQYTKECAWIQYFLTGQQSELGDKDQLYKVRPIRIMT
jgi:hypothetical protein